MPGPDFSIRLGLVGTATVMTGIQSVLNMAGQLVGKIRELAEAADQYGDVVHGHVVSVEQAREATNGLIDSITLHQQAARMEAAGVQLSAEQLRALAVAATNYAQSTGADLNESFTSLTDSVTRCTARGLRPYGIELERGASRGAQQRAVIDQLTRAYGDQTSEVEGTADAITALQNDWSRAWNEMLLSVETNAGPLQSLIRSITSVVNDLGNALEAQRRAQEHMARMGTTAQQLQIQRSLENAGYDVYGHRRTGAAARIQQGIQTYSLFGTQNPDDWAMQQAEMLRMLEQRDLAELANGAPAVAPAATPAYSSQAGGGGGGGGGGRGRNARDRLAGSDIGQRGWDRFVDEATHAEEELNQRVAELYRGYGHDLTEFWSDLGDRWKEGETALAEKRSEAVQAANEAGLQSWEAYVERERELMEQQAEAREALIEKTQGYAQAIGNVYQTLTGAIGDLAISSASSTEEEKKIRGEMYIAEQVGALLLAITMEAVYIMSNNVEGALAAGAAIVAAGIGIAKTAVEFGVHSKSGVGGGGKGGANTARPVGAVDQGYQPSTVVHVNGVVTSAQVNEELIALQRAASRGY
jgi:hypothetical protein